MLIQIYAQFRFFIKVSGTSFPTIFCVWFFRKNISHVILTEQISLCSRLYFLGHWAIFVLQLFLAQPFGSKVQELKFAVSVVYI